MEILQSNNVATVKICIFSANCCYFTGNLTLYCSINRFKTKLWSKISLNINSVNISWIHFTKSKTMNKIIPTLDMAFTTVVGPSPCCKTVSFQNIEWKQIFTQTLNTFFLIQKNAKIIHQY